MSAESLLQVCRVSVVSGDEVSPETTQRWDEWACAEGASYYSNREWFEVQAAKPTLDARVAVATAQQCGITAVVPVFRALAPVNHFYDATRLFAIDEGEVDRLRYLGSVRGYGQTVLGSSGQPTSKWQGMQAVGQHLHRQGLMPLAMFVESADAQQLCRLDGLVSRLAGLKAVLDVPESGWQGVLEGRSRKRRRKMRLERQGFQTGGCEVQTARLDGNVETLAPLFAQSQARHGDPVTVETCERVVGEIAAHTSDHVVFLALCGGRLIGFVLALPWAGTLHVRLGGFDYEALEPDRFEYFNLALYEPLSWAASRGLRRVDYGMGSLDAKCLRGARLVPLWAVTPGGAIDCLTAEDVKAQNVRELSRALEAVPDHETRIAEVRAAHPEAFPSPGETAP